MKKNLVERRGSGMVSKSIEIFPTPKAMDSISSDLAWKILTTISERPMYPNEIARKLKVHEQKVYYHVNRMSRSGIIKVVREEEKQGAICRYFAPVSHGFGVELPGSDTQIHIKEEALSPSTREFFEDFLKEGIFNGSIVVGDPSEHGPYLKVAKDGHHSAQLAMFLGSLCRSGNRNIVKLDTEVKSENAEKRNMIIIGGPVTNMITNEVNAKMKIRFEWKNEWSLVSSISGSRYSHDQCSIIARIRNPWDRNRVVVLLAGIKSEGTKTAIMALTQFNHKILKDFDNKKDFYAIIQGLDKDGDGKVDDIKILEIQN